MAKQPFRSIGMRVRDFARSHIRSYVSSGETVSRHPMPPSWQEDTGEPLVWQEDTTAPPDEGYAAPVEETTPEVTSPYPLQSVSTDQVTPGMLQRLLAAHEERIAREEAEKEALLAAQPPSMQRQVDGDSANHMPRRRRGAVIDMTPPHSSAHSNDAPLTSDELPSDEESSDRFFLNEATPTAVQRAPEVSPAPPGSTKRVTPSPRASNPATSFWRKLFSRGDETSTTTEDIPSAEPDNISADDAALRQDEMPAPRQSDTSTAAPSVQRQPERSSRRTTRSSPVEPTFEQSYESEQTVAGSIEDALSFPDATQITPTGQTSAPSVQRKPETSKRSRARVSQHHASQETPSTPPSVQREIMPEIYTELPDQPGAADQVVTSSSPSSPAIQRAPASEVENSFPSAPVPNAPPSLLGRRARRSTGESGQPTASIQRKRNAEPDVIHSSAPPQSDSVQPEGEHIPAVSDIHETAAASPASARVQRHRDSAVATQPPSEPVRPNRRSQTSNPPPAPEAPHSFEPPTTLPAVPTVQKKATPPAAPQSAPTTSVDTVAHVNEPSTPVEQSSQAVVQRSSAVTSEPATAVPDSAIEQSHGETLARPTTAANRPTEIPRIQGKSRSGRSSSSAPVTGQAVHPPVRDTSSPDVQRHISETSTENTEFAVEPLQPSAVVPPSQTTLNQPISQATPPAAPTQSSPQTKAPSTPNVQRRRSSDATNTPVPTNPTASSNVPPVQRDQAPVDEWQTAPPRTGTEQPLSTMAVPPQSTSETTRHATPHIQRAASDERSQETAIPAEQPAPRLQRKARNATPQSDTPAAHSNAEAPSIQRHMNVPQADESTRLTPTEQQTAPTTQPRVQRSTSQTPEQQNPVQFVVDDDYSSPQDDYSTPDAPTMLTAVPPQTITSHATAVQRETAADVGTTSPPEPRTANTPYVPPSPWAAFMQPPENTADVQRTMTPTRGSAAANAPRAQTPAPIQRTPEADVPGFLSEDVSDELPPVGENDIDLFAAMMNTGMIQPPPAPTVSSSPTPPHISRRSAPETRNQPPQPPYSGQAEVESGLEQHTSDAESTDAELLSLLNLPRTTPVIRRAASQDTVARPSEPAPQHRTSHQDIPPGYIAPPIESEMADWGSIQREITDSPAASSPADGESGQSGQAQPEVDVDKLARDVLDVLRTRLRVEQERRGGKP